MSDVVPIGIAIRQLLQADADVTALTSGRIKPAPLRAPGEPVPTIPTITYQRMGSVRGKTFAGRSHPTRTRIQIDCWATDHDAAEAVFDAVRVALDMAVSSANNIQKIEIVDGSDEFLSEEDVELSRFTADYFVFHAEIPPKALPPL